jgi:H+/Cl- antiporter ClcA
MLPVKLVTCIVVTSLALFFGLGVFLTARQSPLWIRCSCLFIAIVGAIYGVLCFRLEFYRAELRYTTRAYLDHYRTLCGGAAIGALIVLGIYGLVSWYLRRGDRSN